MELHSYAKRRAVKKWTVEQKRRLVDARILNDHMFQIMPKTSLLPWKKVIMQAKLDEFNAVFVRKQWGNMVAKYVQLKKTHNNDEATQALDAETIQKITQEWEHFEPIHNYMTRKTTNLHSYALTTNEGTKAKTKLEQQQQLNEAYGEVFLRNPLQPTNGDDDNAQQQQTNEHHHDQAKKGSGSNSSNEHFNNICSSDTNEAFLNADAALNAKSSSSLNIEILDHHQTTAFQRNYTDHDGYSKKLEQQQCYFADVEEDDTLESLSMQVAPTEYTINGSQVYESKVNIENLLKSFRETHHQLEHQNVISTDEIAIEIKQEEISITPEETSIVDSTATNASAAAVSSTQTKTQQEAPQSSINCNGATNKPEIKSSKRKNLSEREKYYRHKRHFNHRMEQRFDSILYVLGQVAKSKYPDIDVNPLMQTTMTSALSSAVNMVFSSSSSNSDSSDDMNDTLKGVNENLRN